MISLLILGVIASLTIPSLIQNTQKKEEQVKLKKAFSVINQAIAMDKALTGNDLSQYEASGNYNAINTALRNMLIKRLNANQISNSNYIKTSDGIMFNMVYNTGIQGQTPDLVAVTEGRPGGFFASVSVYLHECHAPAGTSLDCSGSDIDDCAYLDFCGQSYGFWCDYDRCAPIPATYGPTALFLNAKNPSKVKYVDGKWVEE